MQYLIVCENYKRICYVTKELADYFVANKIPVRRIRYGAREIFDTIGTHASIRFCTREEEGYNRLGFRGDVIPEYEVIEFLERKRKDDRGRNKNKNES